MMMMISIRKGKNSQKSKNLFRLTETYSKNSFLPNRKNFFRIFFLFFIFLSKLFVCLFVYLINKENSQFNYKIYAFSLS